MRNFIELDDYRISCSLPKEEVIRCRTSNKFNQRYYLYLPASLHENTPLMVSVHGISRNARSHVLSFAECAEHYGVAVLAPRFSRKHFPDFQRLGRERRGCRADLALQMMLDEVHRLSGLAIDRFSLFGHSGGGQFVHRYAMAYPEQVNAIAIGAAGWYTLPDPLNKYPYGIAPNNNLPELHFNAEQFLRIPAAVFVGERDCMRDATLRQSERVDQCQGRTRIERARNWVTAMQEAALEYGYDTNFLMDILPNCGHPFSQAVLYGGLAKQVFDFLFGKRTHAGSHYSKAIGI